MKLLNGTRIYGSGTIDSALTVGTTLAVGTSLTVNNINILTYDSNMFFVSATAGSDSNDGRRIASAFATIKHALAVATSGTIIKIATGTYTEIFPLTVPTGVTLIGEGIRAVTITPTSGTNTQDAFYLNGESSISDFTISGFYKPGYAFKFATGAVVTTKSPYVQRVSVITRGSVTSSSDPYGFVQADAGHGAYIDGSVLLSTSLEPAMLFNEVTFIVPNANGIYATNGARSELVDTFIYFADKAVQAVASSTGFAGAGQTRLKLGTVTSGTFIAGDTIIYKSPSGTTLASGTIASISGSYVYLNGNVAGFTVPINRTAKTVTTYGTAALSTTQKQFGTASLYIDGTTTAYALVPSNSDFLFGISSWTVEFWLYRTTTQTTQVVFDMRSTTASDIAPVIYITSNVLYYYTGGTQRITGPTITNNTWYHVAVSKSATSTRLFINGTQSGSTYTDTNSYIQGDVIIGNSYNGASPFTGYIDDLRISNIARYTTTFTAPTTAQKNDANTVLMLHFDGANASTTISDDAITLQDISSTGASPATAQNLVLADYHQFGAELRFIASAAHYGNSGVTANGVGTDIKLISFNVAFIGTGKDSSDDASLAIQANEIIQSNGGNIYYQTVDHLGDLRIGTNFVVSQRAGSVNFGGAQVNLSSVNQLTVTDGINNANIYPTYISVGDILLSAGTISTQGGSLTIDNGASGNISIVSTTASTSTTTGALTVTGGAGIGGALNIAGAITTNGNNPVPGLGQSIVSAMGWNLA